MPSIWRAPAGTIPSAGTVQAREHPCGQSLPSSLTRPLSHAASLAERFRTLLPLIPHVANATMAQPQVRSASPQSQAPQRKQQQLRVRSRPSPPLRSYPGRPQRTRSRVPMTRRFLHNAPWLSSVSRCLGPTQRRDPVSSSIGGQPHQLIAQRRPITASKKGRLPQRKAYVSTPNSAAMPIKATSTAIISNRSRSRSLSRRSNTSPQDCRQRTRIRLSAFRPDGAEPLCLFLVTSASWRLRGVKRPPNKQATESSHREPWPANARALSVKGNEARPRVICQTRTPPEHGSNGRGLGSPHLAKGYATRAPLRKLTGVPKGSSRNVRHEQPIVSCARIA